MTYIIIPYIPDGVVTKAIKKKLKADGLSYQLGHLGELMDENFTAAIKHNHLLYQADHLKLLKQVKENPQVVDIAFEVLEEMLQAKKRQLPTINEGRIPYYPNYKALFFHTLLNALCQTIGITLAVLFLSQSVALMTALIVIIALLGAFAFIYSLSVCVTYVEAADV